MDINVYVTPSVAARLRKPDAVSFAWASDVDAIACVIYRPGTLERRRA